MGCVSSDRNDLNNHRSKMLVEYLKGIEVKEVKEMKGRENGEVIDQDLNHDYHLGEMIEAFDGSRIKVISDDPSRNNLQCLLCKTTFNQKKMQDHLQSIPHLDRL